MMTRNILILRWYTLVLWERLILGLMLNEKAINSILRISASIVLIMFYNMIVSIQYKCAVVYIISFAQNNRKYSTLCWNIRFERSVGKRIKRSASELLSSNFLSSENSHTILCNNSFVDEVVPPTSLNDRVSLWLYVINQFLFGVLNKMEWWKWLFLP